VPNIAEGRRMNNAQNSEVLILIFNILLIDIFIIVTFYYQTEKDDISVPRKYKYKEHKTMSYTL